MLWSLAWIVLTLPVGLFSFFHLNLHGLSTFSPLTGVIVCAGSVGGARLIYLGGRIGFLLAAIPTAAWAIATMLSFVEQKVWRHGNWTLFLFPALLTLPLITACLAWRQTGWLRDHGPTRHPAQTAPSGRVSS